MYQVMIAEDEMFVRLGLKNTIGWEKFNMHVCYDAKNGEEAYAYYLKHHPEIIITDLRMPLMDGMTLIRRVREQDAHTKFIVITCLEDISLVQEALELGVSSYILKHSSDIPEIEQKLGLLNRELDKSKHLKMLHLKEHIFDEYIYFHTMTAEDFASCVRTVPLRLNPKHLCVMLMRPQGEPRGLSLAASLNGLFEKRGNGEAYCDKSGVVSAIFNIAAKHAKADDPAGEIIGLLPAKMHPIYFGISRCADGFAALGALYREAAEDLHERETAQSANPKVLAALKYIAQNFDKDISLQSAAEHVGITPNYLSNLIMTHTHKSFTSILNQIRIDHAKQLLCESTDTVNIIAEKSGFYNATYFIRVFKKATGYTPSDYRSKPKGH